MTSTWKLTQVVLMVWICITTFPLGLVGVPDEWIEALKANGISRDDVIQNGDAVINALNFNFQTTPLPTAQDLIEMNALLKDGTRTP